MPLRFRRDSKGDPLISIPAFSADEIRALNADAEPPPCADTMDSLRDRLHEVMRDASIEIEWQMLEAQHQKTRADAYRAQLRAVANRRSVPADWLWWPTLMLAAVGVVDVARFIAALLGWL